MVASISTWHDPASAAAYYNRRDEIATERPQFIGSGAMRLNLPDYSPRALTALLHGNHPVTSKFLCQRRRKDRWAAIDITINWPKGATLACHFSRGGEEVRKALLQAALDTLTHDIQPLAMARWTNEMGRTQQRKTDDVTAAVVPHGLARPHKGKALPHEHAHVVVFNMTRDPVSGSMVALNDLAIQKHMPDIERAAHRRAREYLHAAGWNTVDKGKFWDMAGIERSTIRKFSERRGAIELLYEAAEKVTGPLRRAAGVMTREAKKAVDPETLRQQWEDMLSPYEKHTLLHLKAQPKVNRPLNPHRRQLSLVHRVARMVDGGIDRGAVYDR